MHVRLEYNSRNGIPVVAEFRVANNPHGVFCRVGCASENEIVLPRAEFSDLGQQEFRISCVGGELFLDHLRCYSQLSIAGRLHKKGTVSAGVHDLRVNDHSFKLTVGK